MNRHVNGVFVENRRKTGPISMIIPIEIRNSRLEFRLSDVKNSSIFELIFRISFPWFWTMLLCRWCGCISVCMIWHRLCFQMNGKARKIRYYYIHNNFYSLYLSWSKGIIPRIGLDITSNKYNHFANNFSSDAPVVVMLINSFCLCMWKNRIIITALREWEEMKTDRRIHTNALGFWAYSL